MNANDELFPFPAGMGADTVAEDAGGELPPFPGEQPLTDAELRDLRIMLQQFHAGALAGLPGANGPAVLAPPVETAAAVQDAKNTCSNADEDSFASVWQHLNLDDPLELEILALFKEVFSNIQDGNELLRVLWSIASLFPLKKFVRNCTPDQKLMVLNVLGDRFLHGLAGFAHPVRKKLLKAVSRYFSGVSDAFSFLAMESEPFNLQYHERVPGSTASGKVVREMHGFVVVARDTRRVIRLGQVLT